MSRFFEVLSAVCWLVLLANNVLSLWADDTWVIVSALLFTLWAILYEVRGKHDT